MRKALLIVLAGLVIGAGSAGAEDGLAPGSADVLQSQAQDRCDSPVQSLNPDDRAYCTKELRQLQRRQDLSALARQQSLQRQQAEDDRQRLNRNAFVFTAPRALDPPTIQRIAPPH
jgi:hypothetical protein